MSRFYASIKGSRGEATRQGTPQSGIRGHIRGWECGIRVIGYIDDEGKDTFDVYITTGSGPSNFLPDTFAFSVNEGGVVKQNFLPVSI